MKKLTIIFLFLLAGITMQAQNRKIPVKLLKQDSTIILSIQAHSSQFNKLLKTCINNGVKACQDSEIMVLDAVIWVNYENKEYKVFPNDLYDEPSFTSTKVSEVRKYLIEFFK